MKFRNTIFTLLLSFMAFSMFAQSPLTQGQFLVGATSIEDISFADISLTPSVGYALTDQIVVGLGDLQGRDGDWGGSVVGRYYLNSPFFGQASVGYNSVDEDTNFGVGFGVTGFLNKWLYIEPNLGVDFGDDTDFQLGVDLGVRF